MDLTGQKFGRWTVLHQVVNQKGRDAKFLCRCDCWTQRQVLGKNLRNGRSKSCGCYKKEVDTKRIIELNKKSALNLRGQKYGLLSPLQPTDKRDSHGSIIWKCKCDCGNIAYVSVDNLRGQHPTRSCGCIGSSSGEKFIQDILIKNNIEFKKEFIFSDFVYEQTQMHPRYDFYLPSYNRLIEFDGEQHYKEKIGWRKQNLKQTQEKDKIKNQWAKEHNIPLVRIPYWERDNITLDLILGDQYLVKN